VYQLLAVRNQYYQRQATLDSKKPHRLSFEYNIVHICSTLLAEKRDMVSSSRQPTVAAKKMTLRPVLTLKGHKHAIPSVSYFPGGKRMISGSYDKTIRQWDLEAGKEIEEVRDVCEQGVRAVGASRDGRWVVTACGNSDTRDSELRSIRVCEVETGTVRIFQGISRRITCIDIPADNTLLASGSWDGTVQIWSLETGTLAARPFRSAQQANTVRFSQNLKKLAVKSWLENTLEVWDLATQASDIRAKISKKLGARVGMSSTPVLWTIKDQTIVTAFSAAHHSVYEFDVTTLETVGSPFKGHTDVISGLALSLDCALLASASDDNTIKLWAFGSRQLLASFHILSTIHHLILSPDSHQLVYTTLDDTSIYICNTPPEILASIRHVPQVRVCS
jgi:WD40 repeat protein